VGHTSSCSVSHMSVGHVAVDSATVWMCVYGRGEGGIGMIVGA